MIRIFAPAEIEDEVQSLRQLVSSAKFLEMLD